MAAGFVKCGNCGATIAASADGREVSCAYCGATSATGVDPAALAAGLRKDFASVEALFEHLAGRLQRDFPRLTRLETVGGGFFTTGKTVGFELTLDDVILGMKHEGRGIVATRRKIVRGITLKNEKLAIDAWVDALAQALSEHANESAAAKAALERLGKR
jgi:hypothetical protein